MLAGMSNESNHTSAEVSIREAKVADVPLILEFIRALAEYERLSHEVLADEAMLEGELFGKHPGAEVVIAEFQAAPVGFALFFHSFSTFVGRKGLYLEDLYVLPEMRGKGVGKKLLAFLAKTACDRNCGRLEWSVLDWNAPAIEFYRSIGAVPMDEWTVFRMTDDALATLAAQS